MAELDFPDCVSRRCPLHLSCSRIPTVIDRSPFTDSSGPIDILFVADQPTAREMMLKKPFLGPESWMIKQILSDTSEEISYAVTYLVRGWSPDPVTIPPKFLNQSLISCSAYELNRMKSKVLSKHPDQKEIIDRCQKFLIADIQKHRPKLIVIMGKAVKEALFPQEKKTITRLYDSFRTYQGITTRFITTAKSLIQNPSGKKQWETQLKAIATNKIAELDTQPGEDYLIDNIEDALDYIAMLKHSTVPISVDLETLNLNKKYGNKIATIQFTDTTTSGMTIPLFHAESPFTTDELEKVIAALYDLFHNPNSIPYWVGQNLKFECNLLQASIGTQILSAPIFDTQIAAFLLDENRRERFTDFRYGIYTLKQLAYDYLNFDGYDKGTLANRATGSLFDMELKKLSSYGAMDVYITLRLAHALMEEAVRQDYLEDLMKLMFHFYTPVIRLFSDVEQNGFYVNRSHIRHLISKESPLLTEMKNIEKYLEGSFVGQKANALILQKKFPGRIEPLGGRPWIFDFAKTSHTQTLFFSVLRLPPGKIGLSGVPSVDSAWQKDNINDEWVKMFSEWKGYQILYNTFATKLYSRVDPRNMDIDCNTDTRIRPDFILTGPVTGRLACKNPNLQNIPRGDNPAKRSIKNIFQATPGHIMVQLDYKANEIRWVGVMAQDDNLARAINEGRELFLKYRLNPTPEGLYEAEIYGDIHRQMAALIFNKNVKDVYKGERQAAKSVQFGILYGSSVKAIAEAQNKSIEEVQEWFDSFYERFPKITGWKKRMEESACHRGYVETPNGRRRRFPIFDLYRNEHGIFDPNAQHSGDAQMKIAECLRQAVNAPIQGIASDAGMLGAALFSDYIREHNKPWVISNAVHDSCVYLAPYDELAESLKQAEQCFTDGVMSYMTEHFEIDFNLPLEVDFELGLKWGDLEKWNYSPEHLIELKAKFLQERGEQRHETCGDRRW